MVKSFEPGRGQAAFRTSPRLVINLDFPGLDTAYENEGAPPLESTGVLTVKRPL
jgi:hypothetical protein